MIPALSYEDAFNCCSSNVFARLLSQSRPSESTEILIQQAREIWWKQVSVEGWLEAFAAHPRIGDAAGLKKKFGAFGTSSAHEQSTALGTSNDRVFEDLARWNQQYEQKFGHIFIVFASGKTAVEMLDIVRKRYENTPYEEVGNAATEQMKITELRLHRLIETKYTQPAAPPATTSLSQPDSQSPLSKAEFRTGQLVAHLTASPAPTRPPITTHVLDATLGRPAAHLEVTLFRHPPGAPTSIWEPLATGLTNQDGRVGELLAPGSLTPGHYKMWFNTGSYLRACHSQHPHVFAQTPFYPEAAVEFEITADMLDQHFHIPLLLSPYSYSTYRGS